MTEQEEQSVPCKNVCVVQHSSKPTPGRPCYHVCQRKEKTSPIRRPIDLARVTVGLKPPSPEEIGCSPPKTADLHNMKERRCVQRKSAITPSFFGLYPGASMVVRTGTGESKHRHTCNSSLRASSGHWQPRCPLWFKSESTKISIQYCRGSSIS